MPPGRDVQVPATIERSAPSARRVWLGALDGALEQYGESERAYRTAYAALTHTHEKVGDEWVEKEEYGPSDPRSKQTTAQKRRGVGETYGGVDAEGNTKAQLMERARALDIRGRSTMSKAELAAAIGRRQG